VKVQSVRRRGCTETVARTPPYFSPRVFSLEGVRTQGGPARSRREVGRLRCEGGTTWWRTRSAKGRLTQKPSRQVTRRRGDRMTRFVAPHLVRGWFGFAFTHGSFFNQSRPHGVAAVGIRMCPAAGVRRSYKVSTETGRRCPGRCVRYLPHHRSGESAEP
jgi:hypothetical protein